MKKCRNPRQQTKWKFLLPAIDKGFKAFYLYKKKMKLQSEMLQHLENQRKLFGGGMFYSNDGHKIHVKRKGDGLADKRIAAGLPADFIRAYFMRLTQSHAGYKSLLTVEDVEYWLQADFKGFPRTLADRQIKVIGNARSFARVRRFTYNFCINHNLKRDVFCEMLWRRFKMDGSTKIKTVEKHFSDPVWLPPHLE